MMIGGQERRGVSFLQRSTRGKIRAWVVVVVYDENDNDDDNDDGDDDDYDDKRTGGAAFCFCNAHCWQNKQPGLLLPTLSLTMTMAMTIKRQERCVLFLKRSPAAK